MITVVTRDYSNIDPNHREILRYAGCREAEDSIMTLMQDCLQEVSGILHGKTCYCVLSQQDIREICPLKQAIEGSEDLRHLLEGCSQIVVMAATIGVGIDRLMTKYGKIAPSKALMFHAIGVDGVENLCDQVCQDIFKDMGKELTYRFSPGYGDLPLETQRVIFDLLDPAKNIGLTLQESLLMAPSKSVTAIVGVKN